jgi:hypothetical protein
LLSGVTGYFFSPDVLAISSCRFLRIPDRVQYTYWGYFQNAFAHNWDWRIGHIPATAPLAAAYRTSDVDLETRRAPGAPYLRSLTPGSSTQDTEGANGSTGCPTASGTAEDAAS